MINKLFVFVFLSILMMTSCVVYHPQTVDIPLISKKSDLRIDAGVSIVPSGRATISYGLTDILAIQAYGSIKPYESYYLQGAIGLYKKQHSQKVMELYSGFGYGYSSAYNSGNPGYLYGNYKNYFMQLNYGKINSKFANMDYGFGLKAGLLNSSFTDNNYYRLYLEAEPFMIYNDISLLLEPTLFLRLGGEKLKFNVSLGSCWINKFTNIDKEIPYSYISLGLGLNYRF